MSLPAATSPNPRLTRFRWVICGLLFAAITINYVDRAAFGVLAPKLKEIFHWEDSDISSISLWFEIAYAIGLAFAGRILDRVGTKLGLAAAFALWCLAAMLHAGMATVLGFKFARFLLGLPEAGAWPGVNKAAAEWFPRRERATVAGFYNAGSNVGSMIVPLAAPWLLIQFGWQVAFIALGAVGMVWLVFWFAIYRLPALHPRVSPGELALIESDPPDAIVEIMPVARILATRAAWAFIMGKFFTDMVFRWCTYLLPTFFTAHFHLDIKGVGWPLFTIWLMAAGGSIAGGSLSSWLIKRGRSINAARKTAMFVSVLCVLPVMFTTQVSNVWLAVLLVGLLLAAHQSWSSNLYTSVSDLFPKHAVGAVSGYGGTAGAIGATALLYLTSSLFDARKTALAAATAAVTSAQAGGNQAALGVAQVALDAAKANADHVYTVIFVIAGFAYVAALTSFHLLVPKMEPVKAQ